MRSRRSPPSKNSKDFASPPEMQSSRVVPLGICFGQVTGAVTASLMPLRDLRRVSWDSDPETNDGGMDRCDDDPA